VVSASDSERSLEVGSLAAGVDVWLISHSNERGRSARDWEEKVGDERERNIPEESLMTCHWRLKPCVLLDLPATNGAAVDFLWKKRDIGELREEGGEDASRLVPCW